MARRSTSLLASGSVTAPAAGAVIATLTPPKGSYEVRVGCFYVAGAPAAAEDNGFEVRVGSTVLGTIAVTRTLAVPVYVTLFASVDGATAITINGNGASTASVVYSAQIVASKLDG